VTSAGEGDQAQRRPQCLTGGTDRGAGFAQLALLGRPPRANPASEVVGGRRHAGSIGNPQTARHWRLGGEEVAATLRPRRELRRDFYEPDDYRELRGDLQIEFDEIAACSSVLAMEF
jgi:hypothetical protein